MRRIFPSLLVLTILLSVSVYWQIQDQSWPTGDAGAYLVESIHAYSFWQKKDIAGFFYDIYFHRPVKPIAISSIGAFLLIATNGNIPNAVMLYGLFFYFLFLLYLILFFRSISMDRILSALILAVIGSSPWIIASSANFMCEISFLAMMAGFLFHSNQSRWFTRRAHTVAALLVSSIAFTIQPALTFCSITGPICIILYQRKKLGLRNRSLLPYFTFFTAVSFAWYLPKFISLLQWIWRCTFGDLAVEIDLRPDSGGFSFLLSILTQFSFLPIIAVFLSFLFSRIESRSSNIRSINSYSKSLKEIFLLLLSTSLPLLLMAMIIRNGDTRYYLWPTTTLFLVFVLFLPNYSCWWRRLIYLPILALSIFYSVYNLEQAYILPYSNISRAMPNLTCCAPNVREWNHKNLGLEILEKIEQELLTKKIVTSQKNIKIGLISTDYYFCPMQLNLLAYHFKKPFYFDWIDLFRIGRSKNEFMGRIANSFDYIISGPIPMQVESYPKNWLVVVGSLLEILGQREKNINKIEELGLRYLSNFSMIVNPRIPNPNKKIFNIFTNTM